MCDLHTQISKFLNLLEPDLFGLAMSCQGESIHTCFLSYAHSNRLPPSLSLPTDSYIFLDPLEKISKYAPKQWRTQNNVSVASPRSLGPV